MSSRVFILISLCLFFIHYCSAQSCKDDIIAVKGLKYDIKPLKDLGTLITYIDNVQYSFVICGRERGRCGEEECKDALEFSGCVADPFDDFCFGLASSGSDKFDVLPDGTLTITHGNGDKYRDTCYDDHRSELRFEIKCNENATGTPDLDIKIPECPTSDYAVTIKFEHKAGCPIGLAVYLIAGITINAVAREKRGIEMIPNLEFWKDIPGLIKDGFNFVLCRNSGQYETIK